MELLNGSGARSQGQLQASAGCEVSRMPSGHFELKIWGRLPPTWIGSLTAGLSRNCINVIGGSAKKLKTAWQADFEIMATSRASDPNRIDYLALAMEGSAPHLPVTISLDEFLLNDEPGKHDGALYLEVKARDQIGFLGALLNRLAFYTLFPESMIIETANNKVLDRFWIKGMGGQYPSATSIAALRQKLESFLFGRQGKG